MAEAEPLRLLLVEDNPGDARLIVELLREVLGTNFHLDHVERLSSARERLAHGNDCVVLLDLSLPDARGLDTVRGVHEAAADAPIIVLTGLDDEEVALRTLQEGAQDYLVKGRVQGELLLRSIRYARERKRLELERAALYRRARDAAAEAEAAALARDEALRIVSHDIGNSLTAVGIHARLLKRALPVEEPGMEDVSARIAAIQQLVDQMETLRSDLLDVARIEAGHMSLDLEPHDLADILAEAVSLVSEVALERKIALQLKAGEDLPAMRLDRSRILQLMGNLLGNALKYTPPGGAIEVGAERAGNEVRVFVSDTGPGIPADDLPHLFDRYWQARSSRRAGAGLGLAIARGIVEAHGGGISVESGRGRGTTFRVTLPLESEEGAVG